MTYTYSLLSSHSTEQLILLHYELPTPVSCKFYVLGLHDNYLVVAGNAKYILRIYRNDWRSLEEINFELDFLDFVGNKTALVATPLATRTGELVFLIDSPEGTRAAALFHYADGHAPGVEVSIEHGTLLGNAVANIHHIADEFRTPYTRKVLELPYLMDESIVAIAPFLEQDALSYIEALKPKIRHALGTLDKDRGQYGICIGDVNPTNFHVDEHKKITLFDFDQCGYGYRAFEIGKFISSIHSSKLKREIAESFIVAYQQVRPLGRAEIAAIPYFEMVSVIWVMAINAYNADRIGHKWLEKPFWDRRLAILKELENALPAL